MSRAGPAPHRWRAARPGRVRPWAPASWAEPTARLAAPRASAVQTGHGLLPRAPRMRGLRAPAGPGPALAAVLGQRTSLGDLGRRPPGMWRYRELLPMREPERAVSLGEGATALLRVPRLADRIGVPGLLVKDEGTLPTGSFKARGAAVGVSRAVELGVRTLALPTAGNAGAAWAAYGSRAGLAVVVVMPETTPSVIRREAAACGADVYLVPGSISDAGAVVREGCQRYGWYDASTLEEPYRVEGKKTMGFELVDQLGWRLPDVIVYPTGGAGVRRACRAHRRLGAAGDLRGGRARAQAARGLPDPARAARDLRDGAGGHRRDGRRHHGAGRRHRGHGRVPGRRRRAGSRRAAAARRLDRGRPDGGGLQHRDRPAVRGLAARPTAQEAGRRGGAAGGEGMTGNQRGWVGVGDMTALPPTRRLSTRGDRPCHAPEPCSRYSRQPSP